MFPQLFGKYVLERELASGGMARVYLATLRGAVGFEKRLVVKQIRPELASDQAFVRRFVEEAKTTVELSHPNIVPVYELGVEQGVYYIAMELCAGVTLAEVLAHTGRLSPEEGAYLGVEICRALDYAHRRAGVVHRDVTPRNVLIDEEGAVRLIDFGIAAPVTRDGSGSSEIFGSPGHMPPEQLAGKALTAATDVFAVTALLVEAWTCRAPFRRKTARLSDEALREPVPPLSSSEPLLEPLSELIGRGLALDPAQRPVDAEALARPLRDFLRNADAGDVARRLGQRVQKSRRRVERSDPLRTATYTPATPSASDEQNRISSLPESSGGRVATHTFAAREEVSEWTRRLGSDRGSAAASGSGSGPATGSAAGSSSGPSTRKLPSQPPSADETPSLAAASATRSPKAGAALVTEEASEPSRASGFAGPVSRGEQDSAASGRSGPGALYPLLAAGAALLALVALISRSNGSGPSSPAPSTMAAPRSTALALPVARALLPNVPAAPMAATTSSSATRDTSPPVTATLVAATAAQRRALAVASSHETPPAASASVTSADVTTGVLRVTADPPAAVNLSGPSGARAFTTPSRDLKLASGVYVLTFRNDTYGQPVVTRVTLAPGVSRSVHVDFREAEPRVSVR